MASLMNWAGGLLRRAPQAPLRFPTTGFEVIPVTQRLEEEMFDEFRAGDFYPVNIGDIFTSHKYQVVGKLGFGSTSTVWLARNLQSVFHPFLNKTGPRLCHFEDLRTGYHYLRTALDTFPIERSGGEHQCLVQKPMWDSWKDLLRRNPSGRFSDVLLKGGLQHLLRALDYLHTQCKLVIRVNIKADNILHAIADPEILANFVKEEMEAPSPRKVVNGAPVYLSRRLGLPNEWGKIILSDFGCVVDGDIKRNHNAQPDVYRSPEIMLQAPWSYPADIWNVGAMTWDVFQCRHLFYGQDPSGRGYMTRAHLAEIIGLLGPPPADLIKRGVRSKEFFSEDGQWIADVPILKGSSLGKAEHYLKGRNKAMFLKFVRGMLAWRPEDRKTAAELL
ncbi:kinase domain-containing protein [Dichotomopilus funicola]|uniref:non-specific serine/threonine protein kinase n=1 Tax=Dichotomopilus funicola TaxID=1934379 RepID=A0AAN6V7B7_9PEZI|nr:kinase domain-containing protein [Dichotomopilus funicola]